MDRLAPSRHFGLLDKVHLFDKTSQIGTSAANFWLGEIFCVWTKPLRLAPSRQFLLWKKYICCFTSPLRLAPLHGILFLGKFLLFTKPLRLAPSYFCSFGKVFFVDETSQIDTSAAISFLEHELLFWTKPLRQAPPWQYNK